MIGTGYRKRDFKVGDYILYPYVEDEVLKGRILKLMTDEKCEIEVSFPGKKSEEINCDNIVVYYHEIIPMCKGITNFYTRSQKKNKPRQKKSDKVEAETETESE